MSDSTTANDYLTAMLAGQNADQYLLFKLGTETFAVGVHDVEEIRSAVFTTRVPNTPGFILGVMNLRGVIVPVVDLRRQFGIEAIRHHDVDITVILNVEADDKRRTIGVMVDDVVDVCPLAGDIVKPPPDLGSAINTEFIQGIASLNDSIVVVLRTGRLFNLEELSRLDESRSAAEEGSER